MTTSESKCRFFSENESIRIDSLNESNRIDSNRELECSTTQRDLPQGSTRLGAESVDHVSLYEMTAATIANTVPCHTSETQSMSKVCHLCFAVHC